MVFPRTQLTLCQLLVIGLLLTAGCEYRSTRDTTLVEEPQAFALSQELYGEYDDDWYAWTTSLDQGRVTFRVRHFLQGWARVRIYDEDDVEIFDEQYSHYSYYCDCDDEYTEIDFTAIGTPGEWLVRVEVEDFYGSLYLNVD